MINELRKELNDTVSKIIRLNDYIDTLIDTAHDSYMKSKNVTEMAILDAQIRTYWRKKSKIEDNLTIKM